MNRPLIFCPHLFGSTNLLTQVRSQKDGEASLKWNYPISWFRHLRTASLYFDYIFLGQQTRSHELDLKGWGGFKNVIYQFLGSIIYEKSP